ncbi:MAG: FxLYD domain-containing protein [Bryobacteraceae bacterium]
MKRRAVLLVLVAPFSSPCQTKRRERDATRLEVVQLRAAREQGRITLDGEVRNTGTRRLNKPVLIFDLLDADRKTISRRRGPVDEAMLDPGDASSFHFYIPEHVRAVEISVAAEHRGMEIDVVRPGPYPID